MKTVTITDEQGTVLREFQINHVSELCIQQAGRPTRNMYTVTNPDGTERKGLSIAEVADHCLSPIASIRIYAYALRPGLSCKYKIWMITRE